MCNFASWVERRNKVYFLTSEQLFSEKGQAWMKKHGISCVDLCGHGTIRKWYRIDTGDGIDKECSDFSSPDNFPPVIAQAFKNGKMRGIGISKELLTAPAWEAYDEAIATAERVANEAVAIAEKAYNEAVAPAKKAYNEASANANEAYNEAVAPAKKAYDEAVAPIFWDLFAIPENRNPTWR